MLSFAAKGPPRGGSADGPLDAVCLLSSSAADVQTVRPPRPDTQEDNRAPDVFLGATKRAPNTAVVAAIKDLTSRSRLVGGVA
jgi:hypothetical protein